MQVCDCYYIEDMVLRNLNNSTCKCILTFSNLSKGQTPDILYIGCSDSRVSAEELMGIAPGEAFVLRNIANMVPNTDLSAMAIIDYAVLHLKVNHVVVCGHYYCGGVQAAMKSEDICFLAGKL